MNGLLGFGPNFLSPAGMMEPDMGDNLMPPTLAPRAPIETGVPDYIAPEKQGLMSRIGTYFQDPGNRRDLADILNTLAIGFDSMTLRGQGPITQLAAANLAESRKKRESERETQQYVDYLKSRGVVTEEQAAQLVNSPRLAAALVQGAISREFAKPRQPSVFMEKLALVRSADPNLPLQDAVDKVLSSGGTTIDLGDKGKSALYGAAGKLFAEQDAAQITAAQKAVGSIRDLDEIYRVLDSGEPITGMFDQFRLQMDRAKAFFNNDEEAAKRATDTQLLNAFLGADVFDAIAALGIGARGLDTPAEREFLRSVLTGTTSMTEESIRRLTDIRRKALTRAVDQYNSNLKAGNYKYLEEIGIRNFSPIEVPEYTKPEAPAVEGKAVASGTTVTLNGTVRNFPNEAAASSWAKEYNRIKGV